MKLFYLLIFILIIFSCGQKNGKSIKDRVHVTDTICKKEIKRGEDDIKNGKIVFCDYEGSPGHEEVNAVIVPNRREKEMDSLLSLFNIDYEREGGGWRCIIEENRNYDCYCTLMQEEIVRKFGERFTDSLLYIADSLWVIKNLDKEFDNSGFESGWDKPILFPGDKDYDYIGLQRQFDKIVKYPKGYRKKGNGNSLSKLQVYLNVDENGKAKVTDLQLVFWDSNTKEEDYNKEHWNYFKRIAKDIIERTTWMPAKIKGVSVKSKNDISINLN